MNEKGILFIVSGFAGTGKSTITQGLIKKYGCYELSISATTRPAREGEEHGREYFFMNKEDFESQIEDGNFLEYARYLDNYYGTPKKWVDEKLASGQNVILEIEMQGALQIKGKFPKSLLIFVLPPSAEELEHRLTSRGTETKEQIAKRIARAKEEVEFIEKYDYVIVNEDIEKSINIVHNIVMSEKFRVSRNTDEIKAYVADFVK